MLTHIVACIVVMISSAILLGSLTGISAIVLESGELVHISH